MANRTTVWDEQQLQNLESRLSDGLWSSPVLPKGRPPSSMARSSSGVRLAPLDQKSLSRPMTPVTAESSCITASPLRLPSPARRQPGHLGTLNSLRRSAPSLANDWWQLASSQPDGASKRMVELLAPQSEVSEVRRIHQDVRIKRQRRPADVGASLLSLASGTGKTRGRSCAASTGSASSSSASGMAPDSGPSSDLQAAFRGASVPPTGTPKADLQSGSTAKASAVAALQRLFFEEMTRNGGDANGAAAKALLRLNEAPSVVTQSSAAQPVASPASSNPDDEKVAVGCHQSTRGDDSSQSGPEAEEKAKLPKMPQCPPPTQGRRRRPCPGVARMSVAVHA
eukprot:TRINITY_DN47788_c0_g1_i1.p1 TRINITY_DN47788_c0_g1~~TRINITY_DN47788_c0_g1_i1.p1  ORF type:complete len:340 (+),score=72.09 TRINITY_DN47788_c0_g1_i1:91-1110(+)